MLTSGIAYLVGDIAFSSDINKYMESANLLEMCVVGGLVIAAVYSCWYLLRKEKRLADILVPVCTLLVWGLARRKMLYAGGRGVIYSIAYELKKAYGVKTGAIELDYISVGAVYEFVLFVTAVAMFFAAYMIFRCDSIMIAVGLAFLFMASGAMLDVRVSPAGVILTVLSLIVIRYVLMRNGQPLSVVWNVTIPLTVLAACIVAALLIYGKAYERGVKFQGVLIEMVENVEYFFAGDSGKGYSTYYKVDGSSVDPSDEVVDEITRNDKPEGNLYVKSRSYVVYDKGTWRNRDIGYSYDSEILLRYDKDTFSGYEKAIEEISDDTSEDAVVADKVVEYIRQHISYTITPKPFDESKDPILYALYTGHEGYCVHFASAAAIGLRTAGIPTKYNTGYVVPSAAWTRQSDGTYHAYILEKYSHAWIEAYEKERKDWVIVDATPLGNRADTLGIPDEPDNSGNQDGQKTDGSEGSDTESTTEEVTTEVSTEITTQDAEEMTTDSSDDPSGSSTENQASSVSETTTENDTDGSGTGNEDGNGWNQTGGGTGDGDSSNGLSELFDSRPFKIAASIILMVVLLVAAALLRRRVIVTRRRRKLVGRDRITAVHEMSAAMWDMLTFADLTDGVGSDDSEYADIVTERVKIVGGDEFKTFVACVQAAVYGQIVPDDEQLKMARKLYNKIRAYTYWSLNFKERLVWKYVKCYDCGGRRRKR